jgi:hypothetical protein
LEIVYALEEIKYDKPSIFLAGPTPRSNSVTSWRPQALRIIEDLGFDGYVLVPEPRNGSFENWDYIAQVEWEIQGLETCSKIVFWIPREMATMPGLTTNVEFGRYSERRPKEVILGYPPNAVHVRYLGWLAEKQNIPVYDNLEITLLKSIISIESSLEQNNVIKL